MYVKATAAVDLKTCVGGQLWLTGVHVWEDTWGLQGPLCAVLIDSPRDTFSHAPHTTCSSHLTHLDQDLHCVPAPDAPDLQFCVCPMWHVTPMGGGGGGGSC